MTLDMGEGRHRNVFSGIKSAWPEPDQQKADRHEVAKLPRAR